MINHDKIIQFLTRVGNDELGSRTEFHQSGLNGQNREKWTNWLRYSFRIFSLNITSNTYKADLKSESKNQSQNHD